MQFHYISPFYTINLIDKYIISFLVTLCQSMEDDLRNSL